MVLLWIIVGVLAVACLICVGYAEGLAHRVNQKFKYDGCCDEQSKYQQREVFLYAIRHSLALNGVSPLTLLEQQRPFWDAWVCYNNRIMTFRALGYVFLAVAIGLVAILVD